MFLNYFLQAKEYLREHGLQSDLVMGKQVSQADLIALDKSTDLPMPQELKDFYLELGDGFEFIPDNNPNSSLAGWEPMHLSDHRTCNQGFHQQIVEEAMRRIGKPVPPPFFREEKRDPPMDA